MDLGKTRLELTLPRVRERAFYFPQGHIEQVEASTNQGIDQHMPLYDLPFKDPLSCDQCAISG